MVTGIWRTRIKGLTGEQLFGLFTDEEYQELLADAKEADRKNYAAKTAEREEFNKWKAEGKKFLDLANFKKLEKLTPLSDGTPSNEERHCEGFIEGQQGRAINLSDVVMGLIAKAKAEAETTRLEAAIVYLTERGEKLGETFSLADAVSKANNLEFNSQREAKIISMAGGCIPFDGMNDMCEENECDGWDGISNRCSCGNRRVYWTSDGDFRKMTLYGDAW